MPPIEDRIGISTHFLPSTHGEDIFDAIRLVAEADLDRLGDDGYAGPIVCEIQGMDIPQVIRHCQESKDMICGISNNTLTLPNRWYEPQRAL